MNRSLVLTLAVFLSGCSADLVNKASLDDFKTPEGVPWVEQRAYEIYVYQINVGTIDRTTPKVESAKSKLLYFGQHDLSDKLNNEIIDAARPKWESNYAADLFSKSTFKIILDANGAVKEISLEDTPQSAEAVKAAAKAANTPNDIRAKEIERLKKEKELRDAIKALEPEDDKDN